MNRFEGKGGMFRLLRACGFESKEALDLVQQMDDLCYELGYFVTVEKDED